MIRQLLLGATLTASLMAATPAAAQPDQPRAGQHNCVNTREFLAMPYPATRAVVEHAWRARGVWESTDGFYITFRYERCGHRRSPEDRASSYVLAHYSIRTGIAEWTEEY